MLVRLVCCVVFLVGTTFGAWAQKQISEEEIKLLRRNSFYSFVSFLYNSSAKIRQITPTDIKISAILNINQ